MSEDMDQLFLQMQHFRAALEQFNEQLRSSFNALQTQHGIVSGLWQDEFRDEYDVAWERLDHEMTVYVNNEGPNYEQFMDRKIRKLNEYYGR
jgi:uncharacterized protein YukE